MAIEALRQATEALATVVKQHHQAIEVNSTDTESWDQARIPSINDNQFATSLTVGDFSLSCVLITSTTDSDVALQTPVMDEGMAKDINDLLYLITDSNYRGIELGHKWELIRTYSGGKEPLCTSFLHRNLEANAPKRYDNDTRTNEVRVAEFAEAITKVSQEKIKVLPIVP